jgi:stringent starvation protein B
MISAQDTTSTRPYLIRALYEWCTDNGLTPYIAVRVDETVQVPREYVKNDEIVLNISLDATSSLNLGNDFIEFKARFAGTARDILVPVRRVIAIYARENGQGMAFPLGEDPMPEVTAEASPALSPVPKSTLKSAPKAADASSAKASTKLSGKADKVGTDPDTDAPASGDEPEPPKPNGPRPTLTRVK